MLRITLLVAMCAAAVTRLAASNGLTPEMRMDAIARAQVWVKTDVASMDVRHGPSGPQAFAPGQRVTCDFVNRPRGLGSTLKFGCMLPSKRELKIRYGQQNGEVYAQVAASRLLWALGFGANALYPVVVTCRGCGTDPWNQTEATPGLTTTFDPATIDVSMPGRTMELKPDAGWSWKEFDRIDETRGGAPVAQRDALKLLAVLIQHSSNKPSNQRLICLDDARDESGAAAGQRCAHPFMMITDLGKTFGRANLLNRDATASVNFGEWSRMPIWVKIDPGCVGNLLESFSGTLDHPRIHEAGRKFLADLLNQLTDAQLRDLFDVARFTRRDPSASADDWVNAFKRKRSEIANRTCPA